MYSGTQSGLHEFFLCERIAFYDDSDLGPFREISDYEFPKS